MRSNYPHRTGAAKDAYRQHIIDVLRWKEEQYGRKAWDGSVEEELGKRGLQVAREMEAAGLITLKMGSFRTREGMWGSRAFGRSGWVNSQEVETFEMEATDHFPAEGYA